jgi:DNA-binding MarR family transcriptional regulator
MSLSRPQLIQSILENMGSMHRMDAVKGVHRAWPKDMPTRAQMVIMFSLAHRKAQGIKELAQQFGISSSATTQLVNGLVADGLLERTENLKDRRFVHVDLTEKGRKALAAAKAARTKMMAAMFEPLSDTELTQYLALQKKMSEHFHAICLKK